MVMAIEIIEDEEVMVHFKKFVELMEEGLTKGYIKHKQHIFANKEFNTLKEAEEELRDFCNYIFFQYVRLKLLVDKITKNAD